MLRQSHGHSPAAEFGPLALLAVRQAMIDAGWCRTRINKQVGRLRRVFKWAAAREMIPGSVCQDLATLDGLRRGRSAAKDYPKVLPAADEVVEKVLPHMTPTLRAMIELQRLTGMRPGEVRELTPAEVDTSSDLWVYRPGSQRPGGH